MEVGLAISRRATAPLHLAFSIPSSSSKSSNPVFLQTRQSNPCLSSPSIHSLKTLYSCVVSPTSTPTLMVEEEAVQEPLLAESQKPRAVRLDKFGRFSSPRAARELSLLILYASCLEGSDPVRLFEKRVNAKRDPLYVFNKASLLDYDHMSFSGEPVVAQTEAEEQELLIKNQKESLNEEEVLSAPPKLVYSKHVLRYSKRLLEAVLERWDHHVQVMDKVTPASWKDQPGGRILELCILHIAMAEISVLGTRYQIVINESVDLAKRFCDGSAPRFINGCLRTFIKEHMGKLPTSQSANS
ncbi:N utilization substance B-like protein [Nymphaea thermarum]|nr:N utilization substance B-like protein [Nymphaea thermarum]